MSLQVAARGQTFTPAIIDDYDRAKLRCLNHSLSFAPIPAAFSRSFGEKEIDSALVVAVAALEERVIVEKALHSILGWASLGKLLSDSLRHQHLRKEEAQLGHKLEVVESNDTRAVDGTAARPHLN
jgi:hypothetical protein